MAEHNEFSAKVLNEIVTPDVTGVEIEVIINDESYVATGAAKRHPEDDHDPEVAALLAYSDALGAITRKIKRGAEGKIKHNDDVRNGPPRRRVRKRR